VQTEEPAAKTETQETSAAEEKTQEEKKEETTEPKIQNRFKKYAEIYDELTKKYEDKERIEVEVQDRIRGGLRVIYKNVPLFLPASHFSLKRNPSEKELKDSIGKKLTVEIHEIQEYDEGRKAVIVSRKKQLIDEFWNNINVGDIVEGKVSSIASFGVFLDLGGVEGLIHISRLSHTHVEDPAQFVKKGDILKAKVVELDREKNRIALNHKELEPSPWDTVEEDFPVGSIQKGIVKRLTDFGAYIEFKPGVDGLLRTQELSWTKRIKHPSDILEQNQEIEVKVMSASSEKRTIALSYKQTKENPWPTMHEKYPINAEFDGTVFQVIPQGMIVTIDEEVDGFMPRSKMKKVLQGNRIPYKAGEKIRVSIVDIAPEDESLILAPVVSEEEIRAKRKKKVSKSDAPKIKDTGISLGDMIPEEAKKGLIDSM
jgi:small subunit ribosomal protein S1